MNIAFAKPYLVAMLSLEKADSICEECPTTYVLGQKIKLDDFRTRLTPKERQRLQAILYLGRSFGAEEESDKPIMTAQQVRDRFRELANATEEEFWALYLNRSNREIDRVQLFVGGRSSCVVDASVVLRHAIKCNATGIILIHNHPSGRAFPSLNDDETTKQIKQAARLVNMDVIDHIIIAEDNYYAYAENGRI